MSKTLVKPPTISILKLNIPSGCASPSPPVGPALGQKGVKAMDFCKAFNEASLKFYAKNVPLSTTIRIKSSDRSYTWTMASPPISYFLKAITGVTITESVSRRSLIHNHGETQFINGSYVREIPAISGPVAVVSAVHIYEIAKIKSNDPQFKEKSIEEIFKVVLSNAQSLGFRVQ